MTRPNALKTACLAGLMGLALVPAEARPLLTEPVETIGRFAFEGGIEGSYRQDEFGSPKARYETISIPVHALVGFHRTFDLGFTLSHYTQRLESGSSQLEGSRPALFSPRFKYSPTDFAGLQVIYHAALSEESEQELPIARGEDWEINLLLKAPTRWPIYLNLGHVWKNSYSSKFGIENGTQKQVEPGDILQGKASLEIPVAHNFSILTEAAYYSVKSKRINGATLVDSDGEAADALVGVTWAWGGWNIGAGAAFGLMDESHTSFDIERGAGDVTYRAAVAYRLLPAARKKS